MPLTRSQYERIKSEYDSRRSRAIAKRDDRLAKIRISIPEYARLEDESTRVAAAYAKRYLTDPDTDLSELDRELDALSAKRNELLYSGGYSPDCLEPDYVCKDCQDTGYIGDRKCHCFKQAEIELLYNRSNIRELLKTDNFDNIREDLFEGEDLVHFKEAALICHDFADNFDKERDGEDKCLNLMLYGSVGTGKSFLSCCIAKQLIDTGHSVIYSSASDFFKLYGDLMYGRKGDGEDELSLDDDIYTCDLYVLDDLGTELSNQYTCSALFNLLNNRYNARRSTIINTNLSLRELHDRYSDRVFSRLTGYYKIIRLSGPDLRLRSVR